MAGAGAGVGAQRLEARIRDIFNRIHLTLEMAGPDLAAVLPAVNQEARALLERIGYPCGEDTSVLSMPPQPPRPELTGKQRRFLERYPDRHVWRENNPINMETMNIPYPETWMEEAWALNMRNRGAGAVANTVGSKRPRTRKARKAHRNNKN
jgi:hypothetical protein